MQINLTVVFFLLLGCSGLQAADGVHVVRDLGIKLEGTSGFAWCDDTHAVVSNPASSESQQAELVYLDIRNPSRIQKFRYRHAVEMGSGPVNTFYALSCQENLVWFATQKTRASGTMQTHDRQIYSARIGGQAELVAALRDEASIGGVLPIHFKTKYVVGNGRFRSAIPPGSISTECADYIQRGYRLICWDTRDVRVWPLSKFVLAEYKWSDTIPVLQAGSTVIHIANPTQPLSDTSGMPIRYAVVLRDFSGQVLARLTDDVSFTAFRDFVVGDDEKYVYATCRARAEPAMRGANSLCRFKLDGEAKQWELVVAIDRDSEPALVLQMLTSISERGSMVFIARAGSKYGGIWRYDTSRKLAERVTTAYEDTHPKISRDGNSILFLRRERGQTKLMLAQDRGTTK